MLSSIVGKLIINFFLVTVGNFIPISQVRDEVVTAFRKEVEWQADEKLVPYKKMFVQKKVGTVSIIRYCVKKFNFKRFYYSMGRCK